MDTTYVVEWSTKDFAHKDEISYDWKKLVDKLKADPDVVEIWVWERIEECIEQWNREE